MEFYFDTGLRIGHDRFLPLLCDEFHCGYCDRPSWRKWDNTEKPGSIVSTYETVFY